MAKKLKRLLCENPELIQKLAKKIDAERRLAECKVRTCGAKYYGVAIGIKPGVYTSLEKAREQVKGVRPSLYLGFDTKSKAQEFVDKHNPPDKDNAAGDGDGDGDGDGGGDGDGDGGGDGDGECSMSRCLRRSCSLYSC